MNDILPTDTPFWGSSRDNGPQALSRYAYREIRLPWLNRPNCSNASIGEVTDIVEKKCSHLVAVVKKITSA